MKTTALFKPLGVPEHRGSKAALIKERRMQEIGGGANFVADFADHIARLRQGGLNVDFPGVDEFGKAIETHGEHGNFLAGGVMQIAGDSTTLFVLEFQEARGKLA